MDLAALEALIDMLRTKGVSEYSGAVPGNEQATPVALKLAPLPGDLEVEKDEKADFDPTAELAKAYRTGVK